MKQKIPEKATYCLDLLTRPTFDIVADQVLGKTPKWRPSVDLEEGETSLSQIAAKRIGEMREKVESRESDEDTLGDSFGLLKDGRPVWAEVLDNHRGYSTNYSDFGMKDLSFKPLWPPVQKLSDHKTWKNWLLLKRIQEHRTLVKRLLKSQGISMNPRY